MWAYLAILAVLQKIWSNSQNQHWYHWRTLISSYRRRRAKAYTISRRKVKCMHLVLGASGGSGYWTAKNLLERGEIVRLLVRDPSKIPEMTGEGVEIMRGDALSKKEVEAAAKGVSTIFYCVNSPYNLWTKLSIPMLNTTISVAKEVGAKIVLPGNVYIFGRVKEDFVKEDHARNPHTKKGKIKWKWRACLMALGRRTKFRTQ